MEFLGNTVTNINTDVAIKRNINIKLEHITHPSLYTRIRCS
jgi:hypothetical protein